MIDINMQGVVDAFVGRLDRHKFRAFYMNKSHDGDIGLSLHCDLARLALDDYCAIIHARIAGDVESLDLKKTQKAEDAVKAILTKGVGKTVLDRLLCRSWAIEDIFREAYAIWLREFEYGWTLEKALATIEKYN